MDDGSLVPMECKTDWDRLRAMTEEEIEANALSDPDNPPITDEELSRMRWSMEAWVVRGRLKLTQEEFSARFGIPLGTLRDWEQGKKQPSSTAQVLLKVISSHPDAVIDAIERDRRPA